MAISLNVQKMVLKMAVQSYNDFKKKIKSFDIFLRGYPHFGPSKYGVSKMITPLLPMTLLFIAESFSTLKMWMLAKSRAQYVMIRLRYEGA